MNAEHHIVKARSCTCRPNRENNPRPTREVMSVPCGAHVFGRVTGRKGEKLPWIQLRHMPNPHVRRVEYLVALPNITPSDRPPSRSMYPPRRRSLSKPHSCSPFVAQHPRGRGEVCMGRIFRGASALRECIDMMSRLRRCAVGKRGSGGRGRKPRLLTVNDVYPKTRVKT